MSARVRLATGPVSWGVDFADAAGNPEWSDVLDEIAASGFRATELGPVGYLPTEAGRLRHALDSRRLQVNGSFVFQPLHDPGRRADVLAVTRRTCAAIAAAGGSHLVVLDLVSDERVATAGRADAAHRLGDEEWSWLLEAVEAVAAVAREDFGLCPVFHPHAGSYVEFEDEIERLLADAAIDLCIDTGHFAYAGVDPLALYDRHADRVPYLHLKDVDGDVLEQVRAQRLDFWAAIGAGVFCPLGQGVVPFARLFERLAQRGFDGWATVEQDRAPGAGSALGDVIESRRFLASIGAIDAG